MDKHFFKKRLSLRMKIMNKVIIKSDENIFEVLEVPNAPFEKNTLATESYIEKRASREAFEAAMNEVPNVPDEFD